jgi:hypothetical protein
VNFTSSCLAARRCILFHRFTYRREPSGSRAFIVNVIVLRQARGKFILTSRVFIRVAAGLNSVGPGKVGDGMRV